MYVQLSESITLSCSTNHEGLITWTKNNQTTDTAETEYDEKEDKTTSVLKFENTAQYDEGEYVCTFSTLSASFFLRTFG